MKPHGKNGGSFSMSTSNLSSSTIPVVKLEFHLLEYLSGCTPENYQEMEPQKSTQKMLAIRKIKIWAQPSWILGFNKPSPFRTLVSFSCRAFDSHQQKAVTVSRGPKTIRPDFHHEKWRCFDPYMKLYKWVPISFIPRYLISRYK